MATIQTILRLRDNFSNTLNRFSSGIRNATEKQRQLNEQMQRTPAGALNNKLASLVRNYSALYAVGRVINLSDEFTLASSRLGLLTEEMKNANGQLETTAALQDKIYAAAQRSRGSYMDMQQAVSKLGLLAGKSFGNTDEIVAFTENLNKAFTVGGTGSREKVMAMYQLTQAMGSGRLQGDEFRSIIENAPLLAKYIEDYMRNVKGATGTMKEWSAQGMLTADVIKNAVFNMTDEVNAKFDEMPMTWGQVWQTMKNTMIRYTQPILKVINWLANHWSIIGPIVMGVAAALAFYWLWTNAVTLGVKAWTAAQMILNAVMMMNPIGLIIMGVILLIALIYAVVAGINKVAGTSISATGIIVGSVYWIGAAIYNTIMFIGNLMMGLDAMIRAICSNMLTAFHNSIANVQSFFWNLLATATEVISRIANLLNKLPFVNIDVAGLESSASGFRAKAEAAQSRKQKYQNIVDAGNKGFETYKYKNLKDSYSKGYNKGRKWAGKFSGANIPGYSGADFLTGNTPSGLGSLGKDVGDIAKNTAKTAKATEKSSEDLKWLRAIAERKAINKFTTAKIKVDMSGMNNKINSELDIDGVVTHLENKLTERLAVVADGVHI